MSIFKKIFGSKNERDLKKLQPLVDEINQLEPTMQGKSDDELKAMTATFKQRLSQGETLEDILPEAFAVVREAGVRVLGMRHYDVQLVGGIVLHRGIIAEMRTGEGKTLVATLPSYLNALTGRGVHVVTVNDYLARRDAEWMGRLHGFLGLEVGCVVHGVEDYDRQRAYRADITYGQNNEFGFDYLRDNMKMSPGRMVQRPLNYAIVDEVDSILIDEARTPLIISGPAEQSAGLYMEIDRIVPRLKRDVDYTVDEKAHSVHLTDSGVERLEKLLGLKNLYDPDNISTVHHVNQALRAHTLYKRDVNYLIEEGKVVIIDEFTGRKMQGRRWSDGLHQAIEAKENVTIEEENQTLATITFQNFFRMYDKLSGMTGTADTEAAEFHHIYKLEVLVIPTNKPIMRDDQPDLIYKNEKGKFKAVVDDIMEAHQKGQPVLVGTTSVEKSEVVSSILKRHNIKYEVLNAKNHTREASIVAQAGRKGAITISTNMAGRGTDIVLGGNAEEMAKAMAEAEGRESEAPTYEQLLERFQTQCDTEKQEVLKAGGLRVIGTERHESRRIDNQLRGRSGRQGDPGGTRFYLSLEDDLMRIFGAERISGLMEKMGMEEDVPIEHSWVTKAIENAQKKVEGQNFDSRKNVLEYDDVMNQQRKAIYSLRKQILMGEYSPTLSEEDIKEGKVAEPPKVSGDWTEESLKPEVADQVNEIVDLALEQYEDYKGQKASGELDPDEPPTWRKLRHEVWRQTGAHTDVETHIDDSPEELKDFLSTKVAQSLIQQRERLLDLSDEIIGSTVDEHCPPGSNIDAWNLDGLEEALKNEFLVELELPREDLSQEKLAGAAWELVEARVEERMEDLGRSWLLYFLRHFYLEEIDKQWIEHLKTMDHLREGIYLRGYGQKDPKKEYKKEGFDLFSMMMDQTRVNALRNVFRVQVQRNADEDDQVPELKAKERNTVASHESTSSTYGDAADGGKDTQGTKQQTVRRDRPKVGRNDPCPCGSGKKYKKCHGRADGAQASV